MNSNQLYTELCSAKTLQSDDKGFFMEYAHHVITNAGDNWVKKKFGHLKSDHDRIKILYEDKKVYDLVWGSLQHVQKLYRKKNPTVAHEKRIEGEKFLQSNNLQKALISLSQSVLRAPPNKSTMQNFMIDGGITLPLALWSRSEVLLKLNDYSAALIDLQQALKEGLPGKHKSDLYWRMAKCYRGMGDNAKAKISFGLAEKLLENNKKKAELKKDMKQEIIVSAKTENKVMPKLTGDANKTLIGASTLVDISETPEYGRHAVATGDVVPGDTLLIEKPYAACLLPEHFGSHCHHCFKRLSSPIWCPECSGLAFCSVLCRDEALSTYHKYECQILDLLIGSGMSILCHLALRMITQFTFNEVLDIYNRRDKEPIYKLCTLSEKRDPLDFFQRSLMAVFLLRCLQEVDYFPKNSASPQEEIKIAELILLHLQFLQFNAHEIFEIKHAPDNLLRGTKQVNIAISVYQTASLFNHSCYPSVIRYFSGKNIVLTAACPLTKGEVISENYGPIFTRMPTQERKRAMQSRYWFNCTCQACVEEWPTMNNLDDDSVKLRCPTKNCTGFFIFPGDINRKCSVCQQEVTLENSLELLSDCEKKYNNALAEMDDQDTTKIIEYFFESLNTFHRIAIPPHRETHRVQDAMRTCLVSLGNTWEVQPIN